jgi:hypothetical protein
LIQIVAEVLELAGGTAGLAISPDRPVEVIKLLVVGGGDRPGDEADGVARDARARVPRAASRADWHSWRPCQRLSRCG